MKTITIYELLGLVKDGKAPEKIKYMGYNFKYNTNRKRYERYAYEQIWTLNDLVNVDNDLNDEVEILEEEKKIPEKFKVHSLGDTDEYGNYTSSPFPTDKEFMIKINEIIDYLNYLKSKGE